MNSWILIIMLLLLAALAVIFWRMRKPPSVPDQDQRAYVPDQDQRPQVPSQGQSAQVRTLDQRAVRRTMEQRAYVPDQDQRPPVLDQGQRAPMPDPGQRAPVLDPGQRPRAPEVPQSLPDVDQGVLDQLRAAGSDLSKPHFMEFYLYFSTEESAKMAAGKIQAEGFKTEVKRAPQGPAWMCYVTRRMVPKRADIAAIGKRFNAVAQEFNGEYDGWETSVEK